jgi:diguanylate cyclase (GGDEF)-like protein
MTGVTRTWLCPTDLDRARVVDAGERVKRIRTVGSLAVGLTLVAAEPWLGWWTLILFVVSALNFGTVDRLMARSSKPEWVSVRAIVITLALMAVGVVLSGGPSSPALPWLVLPAGMVAARFRPQVVTLGLLLTTGVILTVTLGLDPAKTLDNPVPLMTTLALLAGVVSIVWALQGAELYQLGAATFDHLTGLANRRQLVKDLEAACAGTGEREHSLLMFDLDGFKAYNDTFGHLGGDLLLARLSRQFMAALGTRGRAFRMGGDEFCALVEDRASEELIEACLAALTAQGEGFSITASFGQVRIPVEASRAEAALALADERMYAFKDSRRTSAGCQTRDLALQVIAAYEPALHEHANHVAELTGAVAKRMGLAGHDLNDAIRAAELHDIGKVAIPFGMLRKDGPLEDQEWRLMERHPAIGENILQAAPALSRVAAIVGATHERWDGRGYPKGLTGKEIPLAARIVFVCDSFDAMVSEQPFGEAKTHEHALSELERCAGSQFDPEVVREFVTEVRVRGALALQSKSRSSSEVAGLRLPARPLA